jgi:hypothetical protein
VSAQTTGKAHMKIRNLRVEWNIAEGRNYIYHNVGFLLSTSWAWVRTIGRYIFRSRIGGLLPSATPIAWVSENNLKFACLPELSDNISLTFILQEVVMAIYEEAASGGWPRSVVRVTNACRLPIKVTRPERNSCVAMCRLSYAPPFDRNAEACICMQCLADIEAPIDSERSFSCKGIF